jgi:3-deoxy-D-manno-octulosonic-acid transferase
MLIIYNILLRISLLILKIISSFNSKLRLGFEGRKHWKHQIEIIPRDNEIIWFHCASLGEFDQGLPLMNLIKSKNPSFQRSNAKEFFTTLNPKMGFIVKYEFWPNFLNAAKKQKIPVFSVATILRPNQIYFKWFVGLFRNALKNIEFFFVQNKETADLLSSLKIKNHQIIGDTRYDRVLENKLLFEKSAKKKDFEIFNQFLKGEKALIFGSSWSPEENILLSFLKVNQTQKIILAPHDVSNSNIGLIHDKLGAKAVRFTLFDRDYKNQQVLILDTIGHLSTAYSFGKIALVGGGFSGNLHNILEPAVFGLPVFFGQKHEKFPEADEFIEQGIGFEVENFHDFQIKLTEIESQLNNIALLTTTFVDKQRGASEKILETLIRKGFE